jgi:hypothetical protein
MPAIRIMAADTDLPTRVASDNNCKKNSSLQYFYFRSTARPTHTMMDKQITPGAHFSQPVEKKSKKCIIKIDKQMGRKPDPWYGYCWSLPEIHLRCTICTLSTHK